jgi:hypothetical protein
LPGFYAGASTDIAATGQTLAQVPHDMHFAGSITHLDASPTDIAATGHMPMHVWHAMHLLGSILYGMIVLLYENKLILSHLQHHRPAAAYALAGERE